MSQPTRSETASPLRDEYTKYRGKWIALDSTDTRVLASADESGSLEDKLVAAGLDPENVLFDRIEDKDVILGGAGLASSNGIRGQTAFGVGSISSNRQRKNEPSDRTNHTSKS